VATLFYLVMNERGMFFLRRADRGSLEYECQDALHMRRFMKIGHAMPCPGMSSMSSSSSSDSSMGIMPIPASFSAALTTPPVSIFPPSSPIALEVKV
jgi:hypothetical protein